MALLFLYLWLILIFLAAYALERVLISIFSTKTFRIFVAPGIVVHELSHILGAKLSGSKIMDYRFFDPRGGYVKFTQPKIPIIGNSLVSFAPLFFGSVVILLLGLLLKIQITSFTNPPNLSEFINIFKNVRIFNFGDIILLYFIMSIAAALAPSKQDFAIAWKGLIPFVILTILIFFIPKADLLINNLASLYFICFVLICAILIVALLIFELKKIIVKK
jgi:hypothetical protein